MALAAAVESMPTVLALGIWSHAFVTLTLTTNRLRFTCEVPFRTGILTFDKSKLPLQGALARRELSGRRR